MSSTITKPDKPVIPKPYLEFKYKQVIMIGDLGDGAYHAIPTRMVEHPLPEGSFAPSQGRYGSALITTPIRIQPSFDLEHIHKIELLDERPRVPKRAAGMSDGMFEKLCDAAYEKAAQAAQHNDEIRRRVYHYVDQGILEVIADPFAGSDEVEGFDLIAELVKPDKTEETPDTELKSRVEPKSKSRRVSRPNNEF